MSKEKLALGISKDQTNPGNEEDNKKFSEIVYKAGGINRGPSGSTYTYKGVSSQEELDELLASGWSATLKEAVANAPKKKSTGEQSVSLDMIAQIKAQLRAELRAEYELESKPSKREKAPAKVEDPSEFTSEDYYNLYAEGKSNKEITELTGNKSPWMSAKSYAEANGLPYPPEKKD